MPYRHAHFYLLLLFPLTAAAFWPNYFSRLSASPWAFHVHGATASLWIALLAFQSWSIHRRRPALHRKAGFAGFALFPFFFVGGLLVIQTMAVKFAARADPFYEMFGARLGAIDIVSSLAIPWLFFQALRHRRKVQLHARYMLATVFFLISPILGRLLPILPPLSISGPHDLYRFGYAVQLGNGVALALALFLYFRARERGRPWLVVAGLIAVQCLLFETLARTAAWDALYASFAGMPVALLVNLGFAAGAAVVWAGWSAARPAARPPRTA